MITTSHYWSQVSNRSSTSTTSIGTQCHEWVECLKSADFTLGENTNNHLESINAKVKSVCSKYVSLSKFFDQFFAVLT